MSDVYSVTETLMNNATTITNQRRQIQALIETGKELREVMDRDLICPDCGTGDHHTARCAATHWDAALLELKVDAAIANHAPSTAVTGVRR